MNSALPALPPVLDLAGTVVFALTGALLAARLHQTFVTMAFFALVTGVGGGIIRDVLAGRPSILMRPELYVTAAALSTGLCVLGKLANLPDAATWTIAVLGGFGLRAAALVWGLALPGHRG